MLKRPTKTYREIEPLVEEIFDEIREKGDAAVKKYAFKFDRVELDDLRVSQEEIRQATEQVDQNLRGAIALAKDNIERFHTAQKRENPVVETTSGVNCWQEQRPIEKVGLYIPGGSAPLFSTILMLAIPAKLAGCKEIVFCTPSDRKGRVHPAVLYTASLCGIDKIFKVGGIQAIGAMAIGTQSIPCVYKIFGPGNQYVTVAKQMATQLGVSIDLPAGPSELLVLADDTAEPSFVAADLLSQAEHGEDSQVVLVSLSARLLEDVSREIEVQLAELPRRDIASRSIENSKMIHMPELEDALQLVNAYAPEHLIVCLEQQGEVLKAIVNAGSVFIGNYSPESAGDYASGTNHTLPTNGFARNFSGVTLEAFQKTISFQDISKKGLRNIGRAIELMADAEGLQAHKNAVTLRLRSLSNENTEKE